MPHLLSIILHGITSCIKGGLFSYTLPLPYKCAGWNHSLMGLLSHNWANIHNLYLQYLGLNITSRRFISSLIRKLYDTAWDFWTYNNHDLHATDEPTKTEILSFIYTIIKFHLLRGMTGLPHSYHFLFKINFHTLISRTVNQ